jgi:hypothetical protein
VDARLRPASRRGSIDHAMLASACSRAACGLIARSDGSARLHAPGVFGVNAAGASPRPVAAYATTRFGCKSGGGPKPGAARTTDPAAVPFGACRDWIPLPPLAVCAPTPLRLLPLHRSPTDPCKYSRHVSGAMAVGVGYSVHGVLQATDGREAA